MEAMLVSRCFASLRLRPARANVGSATHGTAITTKPFAPPVSRTISMVWPPVFSISRPGLLPA